MEKTRSIPCLAIGTLLVAVGLAVFGVRLLHAGPYAIPQGGALFGGLGAVALGLALLWIGKLRPWGWLLVVVCPAALFPALYSIMGEAEEVISLFAKGPGDELVDLRLWIVDRDDGAWVGMKREKAIANRLDGQRLSMLRNGQLDCVVPVLHEDRETVDEIHGMKVEKYKAAQISGAMGMYPLQATASTVVLRLDPCATVDP
ncbi:MAG: hypothetical protein AAGG11_22960 [Pseudomonadota bacterium]